MGRMLTVAGIIVSVIGLASFWDDLNGWWELVTGNLLGSFAVLLGILIIAYANRVRLRVWIGWATVEDWRDICSNWLLKLGYAVRRADDKDFVWTIVAVDRWRHEVSVWVRNDERDLVAVGFAYDFLRAEGKRRAGGSQELAETLIVEMGRYGLLYNGLKAPMAKAFVFTNIPLNAELTKHRFVGVVDRVRLAIEAFAVLVEQTERATQPTPDIAGAQPR